MATAEQTEFNDVLERVRLWSPKTQLTLARKIVESAGSSKNNGESNRRPLSEIVGIAGTSEPPPDDVECRRIVDEARMRKHG